MQRNTALPQRTAQRPRQRVGALLVGLLLAAIAATAPGVSNAATAHGAVRAAFPSTQPAACTGWKSTTVPPDTIRVMRVSTGQVDIVPFKLYVYRSHVAEFYSGTSPYTDALLGAGAVAIKQNAWSWALSTAVGAANGVSPRNWGSLVNALSIAETNWVGADYADDHAINGSAGNPAFVDTVGSTARQMRADQNHTNALYMRIRYGRDLDYPNMNGTVKEWDPATSQYVASPTKPSDATLAAHWTRAQGAGLRWDGATSTYTSPRSDGSGRSCFDITDDPAFNQYYNDGGIYDPGWTSGGASNARYNAAVDATWGLSLHRLRNGTYQLWHVTFYGSFTGGAAMGTPGYFPCLLAPHVGDTNVPMSNDTAVRGWTLFPQNADQCVIDSSLTTEQILNEFFFTFDAGPDPWPTININGRNFRVPAMINDVTPIRILTPGNDATGDGYGDFIAIQESGIPKTGSNLRIISADTQVNASGQLLGKAAGRLVLATGESLVSRLFSRSAADGGLSITDLRRAVDGSLAVVSTPLRGGILKAATRLLDGSTAIAATSTVSLAAIDTANDGTDDLFLVERTAPDDAGATTVRIYAIPRDGGSLAELAEVPAGSDARALFGDFNGDGTPDALVLWRDAQGALISSLAAGSGIPPLTPYNLGTFSTPGALLWPISSDWSATAADVTGTDNTELYVRYRDLAGVGHLVRVTLGVQNPDVVTNPDLVFTPETEPAQFTAVRTGEGTLSKVAARTKLSVAQLVALNSGPTTTATIRKSDTYSKLATRTHTSAACLQTMNKNMALVAGKTILVPIETTGCVLATSSVLYLGTPIRVRAGEFNWIKASDTWEAIAARAAAMGILGADAASMQALNGGVDLATATVASPVRIRAPWAPIVRLADAAAPFTDGTSTLAWESPAEVWRAIGAGPVPAILVRDWTGDGRDDLVFSSSSASGLTLQVLGYANDRLSVSKTITRPALTSTWVPR